ncbi:serine/threonine-protein kinase [Actinocorallia populi]|uniref:serine/threonine-protein kinase n=1 Tax=Actinocorallia populi TaxID=2079200 RepID=UPI0018E566F5|nr:serine/threonine-protein kinase [Actinocorallia populi]
MEGLRDEDPRRVGGYELLGRLGAGGMGQVFLGRSPGGRMVAVKTIHRSLTADQRFRVRFAREVAAIRRVGGFHTAPVVDADPEADPAWLVTAYVPGPSLREAVAVHGPLPEPAVAALGAGLAEGLNAVHTCGLVHRDLKPGNVILAADGPRIIDFGIAHITDASSLTVTGALLGTPSYMSPEQARSEGEVGPASDVFSLGCVLFFAACGRGPFDSPVPAVSVHRILNEEPALDAVPETLRDLIAACLDKDPAARPSPPAVLRRLSLAGEPTGDWLPPTVTSMIDDLSAAVAALRPTTSPAPAASPPPAARASTDPSTPAPSASPTGAAPPDLAPAEGPDGSPANTALPGTAAPTGHGASSGPAGSVPPNTAAPTDPSRSSATAKPALPGAAAPDALSGHAGVVPPGSAAPTDPSRFSGSGGPVHFAAGEGGGVEGASRRRSRLLTLLPAVAVLPLAALGAAALWWPVDEPGATPAAVTAGTSPPAGGTITRNTAGGPSPRPGSAEREEGPSRRPAGNGPSARNEPSPDEQQPSPVRSSEPPDDRSEEPGSAAPKPWRCRGDYAQVPRSKIWIRPCIRLERDGIGYVVHARAMEESGTGGPVSLWVWASDEDVVKYRDSLRKCRITLDSAEEVSACGPFTFTPPKPGAYHAASDTSPADDELPPTWSPQWTGTGSVSTVRWPP